MDKYIFRKRKVLDNQTCTHIISIFEKSNPVFREEHDYYGISPHLIEDIKFSFLKPILRKCVGEYLKKHIFLNCLYSKWDVEDRFNIQKYNPGQYYDSMFDVVRCQGHMEHGADEHNSRRLLGLMFYLNDIKNKGGTCWPQQNFTSKPRAGDLYIWPAGWTHSHYGIPAPTETKYIITGWCSFSSSGIFGFQE